MGDRLTPKVNLKFRISQKIPLFLLYYSIKKKQASKISLLF